MCSYVRVSKRLSLITVAGAAAAAAATAAADDLPEFIHNDHRKSVNQPPLNWIVVNVYVCGCTHGGPKIGRQAPLAHSSLVHQAVNQSI